MEWEDEDLKHYHVRRVAVESLLCRFKTICPAGQIDSACHQGNKSNGQAESSSLPYDVTVQTIDKMQLTTFQDNAKDKGHPNRLFYGVNNADSILVDSLSPGGEVPSSISCFMVEKDGKKILFDAGLGTAKGDLLQDTLPVFTRVTVYAPQVE